MVRTAKLGIVDLQENLVLLAFKEHMDEGDLLDQQVSEEEKENEDLQVKEDPQEFQESQDHRELADLQETEEPPVTPVQKENLDQEVFLDP